MAGGTVPQPNGRSARPALVTGAATTFVTVPFCVSKIWLPVGEVSSKTIGCAAESPLNVPWVTVLPVKENSPKPVTEPLLVMFAPVVMPDDALQERAVVLPRRPVDRTGSSRR